MAVLGLPSTAAARTFPTAAAARVLPTSSPSAGLSTIPYAGITLTTLLARIRERLLATFWTDAELTLYVQEGLRIWNTLTGYYRERADVTLAASQAHYTLAEEVEDAMALLRVDTASAHLDATSLQELGEFEPTYQSTAAGTPTHWLPIGMNLFALYPQASGSFAVTLDYCRMAPVPVLGEDYIQLGGEDLVALIDYVTWMARFKEGGQELQDAMPLFQNFLRQAAKHNSRLLASAIFRRLLGLPAGGQPPARPDALASTPYRR